MTDDVKLLAIALLSLGLLALVACTAPAAAPEPIIRTVEVQVPVVQPCPALDRLGPAPAYPDTDEALRTAPSLYERVQLLLAARALRIGRLAGTEAALAICGASQESQ